jgi:inorganic pyrophosphatase
MRKVATTSSSACPEATRSGRAGVRDLADINAAFRAEIEQFFRVYKDLEGVRTRTAGFGERSKALSVLADAQARNAAAEHRTQPTD